MTFQKDKSIYWREKTYYHVLFQNAYVAYISVADSDDPKSGWTVWSANARTYENPEVSDAIRAYAWEHVDLCRDCGSCAGGRRKQVFGKAFDSVCGCTFRVDRAGMEALPFLQEMILLKKQEILSKM